MTDIANGWTVETRIVHFEHIPEAAGDALLARRDLAHVVETVNGSFDKSKENVHLNLYFALSLSQAIGLAAELELTFLDAQIAEYVVGIRAATEDEDARFWRVYEHYEGMTPPALSEEEAAGLNDDA